MGTGVYTSVSPARSHRRRIGADQFGGERRGGRAKHASFRNLVGAVPWQASSPFPLLPGCSKKDDPITQAEKKDKDKPGIAETKAIAEEGSSTAYPS